MHTPLQLKSGSLRCSYTHPQGGPAKHKGNEEYTEIAAMLGIETSRRYGDEVRTNRGHDGGGGGAKI